MKTKITTLLGIESPVVQGGMAWVAESNLAVAVSNAGALGIIGAASAPAEWVRAQIQEVKRRTDKPFGVNIMLMSPYADSVATCIGAIFGTTNTTAYVESLSGVAIGARTGFSSVVVGILFLISLFFSPLLTVITSAVTAPALILVGSLMCSNLKEIEWEKPEVAISSFFTVILMPLTYSIGEGIAFGFLSYVVLMIFKGKAKKIHPVMYVLAVLFIIYFAVR